MGDELVADIFGHILAQGLRRYTSQPQFNSTPRVSLDGQLGGVLLVDGRGWPVAKPRPKLSLSDLNFAVLGGGSLLEPVPTTWGSFCTLLRSAGRRDLPLYLHAPGTQLDAPVRSLDSLKCIKKPAFGGLRGPLTADLLKRLSNVWAHHNRGRSAERYFASLPIISDSGILAGRIFPRNTSALVEAVDQAAASTPAGVLCLSGTPNGLQISKVLRTWVSKYTVVLMPVDPQTYTHQRHKLTAHMASLGPNATSRVFLNPDVTNYGVWLALLDRCTIMLTSRLHAVIMSASAKARFALFAEGTRGTIKMQDFLRQTFGQDVKHFRVKPGFRGTLEDIDELLSQDAMSTWRARYHEPYEQRAISAAYDMHLDSMGKLLNVLLSNRDLRRISDVQVEMRRFWDSAAITIGIR